MTIHCIWQKHSKTVHTNDDADGCHDADCRKDEKSEKTELNEGNRTEAEVTVHSSDAGPECPPSTSKREARCRRHKKLAIRRPKDQLMCRANSLKKAFRQIIEHAEKGMRGFSLTIIIYTIILLKSVAVRKLQVAILARSSREISQTARIDCRPFLSRVRISVRQICYR